VIPTDGFQLRFFLRGAVRRAAKPKREQEAQRRHASEGTARSGERSGRRPSPAVAAVA